MVQRADKKREAIKAEENLVIDVQLMIQRLLNQKKMSRADLARSLGVSQARLSQVMAVDANPTVRTLAQIFFALGCSLKVQECALDCVDELIERDASKEVKVGEGWVKASYYDGKGRRAAIAKDHLRPIWQGAVRRREGVVDQYSNDNHHKSRQRSAA